MRNSDLGEVEWGGHLELRSLGIALNRPIYVYSVQSGAKPLAIHEESGSKQTDNEPILLSYHLHYYALGKGRGVEICSESLVLVSSVAANYYLSTMFFYRSLLSNFISLHY